MVLNNLYRVVHENDLDEILLENAHRLVAIMFVTKTIDAQLQLKKCLMQLASENPNNFFVYIDVNSYTTTNNRLTKKIEKMPSTYLYLDNEEAACVQGNQPKLIYETFLQLAKKIEEMNGNENTVVINQKFLQKIQPTQSQSNQNQGKSNQNQIYHNNQTQNMQPINQGQFNDQSNQNEDIENPQEQQQMNAFQKLKQVQQLLAIQQLEKLKRLKELEEKHKN